MHSGNWEYHGYDLEDFNEVPHEIKERYNHWKSNCMELKLEITSHTKLCLLTVLLLW